MSLINVSNLTFAYEGSYDNIFTNASFQIDTDWKLGFTGRNGRGKTTFLHLLMGKYEYSGTISATVQFQYFPYHVPDETALTSDAVEQISPMYPKWQLIRELSLLDIPEEVLHRPFNTLSNGEQTKIKLAALFLGENNFLLIDEPTNHLDMLGREIVQRYLNSKSGFILVSHDRAFLDGCVTHILSINKANIEVRRGNFSSWLSNKERQDNFERATNEKLAKDIKRLNTAIKRTAKWSDKVEKTKYGNSHEPGSKPADRGYIGAKSAKMMKRSKAIEQRQQSAIEEKSALLKNIDYASGLKLSQLDYHKSRYLALSAVSIAFVKKNICNDITLTVNRGDRVLIHGKNGSGKSSLLKLITEQDVEFTYTGEFQKGSGLKISYVSQDTSHLRGNLSDYAREYCIDESLFKAILRKLDFLRVQFEKDMSDFSGGQKKKVLIARSLCEKAHLLVWDEPLNFVDVLSRMQIEALLLEYKPTIVFVEHDRIFCDKIATKIIHV